MECCVGKWVQNAVHLRAVIHSRDLEDQKRVLGDGQRNALK